MLLKKSLDVKITDESAGLVSAVFSTLNVKDSDGDVTLPGAFREGAEVRISAYNHASWGAGMLPVGKGTIRTTDSEAILEGRFFLDTEAGRDTFTVVKELGSLGEWSYGFDVLDSEFGEHAGEPVQFLKSLEVHEVSPVILGAGVGTRTLSAKGRALDAPLDLPVSLVAAGQKRWEADAVSLEALEADSAVFALDRGDRQRFFKVGYSAGTDGVELAAAEVEVERRVEFGPADPAAPADAGMKLSEQGAAVLAAVESLTTRAAEVKAKRAEKGKNLGAESATVLSGLQSALKSLEAVLVSGSDTETENAAALEVERARANMRSY